MRRPAALAALLLLTACSPAGCGQTGSGPETVDPVAPGDTVAPVEPDVPAETPPPETPPEPEPVEDRKSTRLNSSHI